MEITTPLSVSHFINRDPIRHSWFGSNAYLATQKPTKNGFKDVFFGARAKKSLSPKDEDTIRQFFDFMGVKPGDGRLGQFIQFIKENSALKKTNLIGILATWLEKASEANAAETGGTITQGVDAKTGTRVTTKASHSNNSPPNMGTVVSTTHRGGSNSKGPIVVYPNLGELDSSNQNAGTQEQLTQAIGETAMAGVKAIKAHKVALRRQEGSIPIDDISLYYDFPKPVSPGLYATHGTDTLEESSSFIAYLLLNLVAVLTGSFSTEEEEGSDAVQNKARAKQLAENPSTPIGTYDVIGDEIHLATRLKKINTKPWKSNSPTPYNHAKPWRSGSKISYFASADDKPVGYFDKKGNIHFDTSFLNEWEKILQARSQSNSTSAQPHELNPVYGLKPSYVEIVQVNQHTPEAVFIDLIKRLEARNEPCGAIIEGNMYAHPKARAFNRKINALREQNIFIIQTSAKQEMRDPLKGCDFIRPTQLRIKLSALIARDNGRGLFSPSDLWENYAGELLTKEIAQENAIHVPQKFYDVGEFITPFIGIDESNVFDDAIKRLERIKAKTLPEGTQKPILLINGYGDGHLPIGAMTMEDRIRKGFKGVKNDSKLIGPQLLKNLKRDKNQSYSLPNILEQLTPLLDGDSNLAKDILRKAFMRSDTLLETLGNASESGIDILMGSKPDYATPEPDAYEIGTILKLVGVKAITKPTREFLKDFELR